MLMTISANAELLLYQSSTVASLGWMSPGAATEGVTPIFCLSPSLFLISLGCHSPVDWTVSPRTFFTSPTAYVHYSL